MQSIHPFSHLTDAQLVDALARAVAGERVSTAAVVATLAEFDARRLYLPKGYSSLFAYCVGELKLTEDATFNRVEAARAARRFPIILELLERGELSLTAARMLAPHLTKENHLAVLRDARHKTKRDIEHLVACLRPAPPVPSVVRKLPSLPSREPTANEAGAVSNAAPALDSAAAPAMPSAPLQPVVPASRRPVVAPLSEAHYKLQVTISAKAHERLRQIQDLMRHGLPSGDPAVIVERALEVLHGDLLKKKAAEVVRPRSTRASGDGRGRYIPAAVKRAVWRRDEARCAFVGEEEKRCGATAGLEYHHVQPFATGGEATVDNIEMRCRAHNGFEWQQHLDGEATALVDR